MCAPPEGPRVCTESGGPDPPPAHTAEAPPEEVAEVKEQHESICSLRYIINCFLLPMTVGGLNGFPWSGVGLHFREQEWALWRLGLCSFFGFAVRMAVVSSMLKWGFWLCLPICVVHLLCLLLILSSHLLHRCLLKPGWLREELGRSGGFPGQAQGFEESEDLGHGGGHSTSSSVLGGGSGARDR